MLLVSIVKDKQWKAMLRGEMWIENLASPSVSKWDDVNLNSNDVV